MASKPSYQDLLNKVSELEKTLPEQPAHSKTISSNEHHPHQLQFIKTLLDTIPSPVYYKNAKGIYLGCNRAFSEQIVGRPPEQIIGKSLFDLPHVVPQDFAEKYYQQDLALIANSGTQFYEGPVQCADNLQRDFLFYKATYTDESGTVAGIVGVMLDITQKNAIQKALQESEEKYRSMMESMADPAYICSPELIVSYMNTAMIEYIGYDATGEKCHKALHNLTTPCTQCNMPKVQTGKSHQSEVISPKNNRHYSISNSPIFHQDGTISKMTIYRDITPIKEMEKKLSEAQKLEAVGILAGGIAHDFNNLFTTIMGNILIALKEVENQPTVKTLLQEAETASSRAINLTRRLLAFAKDETISLQTVSISKLLHNAQKEVLEKTKFQVELSLPATLWKSKLDPDLTLYTFENIFKNAIQAMPKGGRLKVIARNLTHTSSPDKKLPFLPGKYVHIEIGDEGVGIEKSDLKNVFTPYYSTQKRGVTNGMGLGLATSRSILAQQSGEITIESEVGTGTRVHIYLPAFLE